MAYYFLFPEKDTTIYSHPYRTDLNTGRVETLSLTSEKGASDDYYYPSRFLIKFKDSEIQDVITNVISGSFASNLKLYATEFNNNLPISQNIKLNPLYDSWENGSQRYEDHPYFSGVVSDGASWIYKNNGTTKTSWTGPTTGTTSSYSGSILNGLGGSWYTGSGFESSQSIDLTTDLDLNFNVTSQIQKFSASLFASQTYPDGITNNGFIIRRENDVFNNSSDQGTLKYFSVDTHTIFSPTLMFKWDDSSYVVPRPSDYDNTLSSGKIQLNITNLKQEYKQSEEPIIKIYARPQYPDREFTTTSIYIRPYFLNATAYYSIEDYTSKEVIIPFDTDYTKISANSEGMYFKLYMQGLQPERYYRLLIRHDNNDGINVYDENWYFKVVR
jgi:hypothetical protein